MTHSCPRCGRSYPVKLKDSWLIGCSNCSCMVYGSLALPDEYFKMVDDWSVIQIGTTGKYKDKPFEITGRVRLQFRSDFRNLWCASYGDKTLWISQSLESVGLFASSFAKYPIEFNKPNAGMYIEFSDKIKLKCELVDQCSSIRFEGEIARFPYASGNFLFIQASNAAGNTVLICRQHDFALEFLWGEMKLVNTVTFEKTRQFHDWK